MPTIMHDIQHAYCLSQLNFLNANVYWKRFIHGFIDTLWCLKRDTGLSIGTFQAGYIGVHQAGYIGVKVSNERPVSFFKHQKVPANFIYQAFDSKLIQLLKIISNVLTIISKGFEVSLQQPPPFCQLPGGLDFFRQVELSLYFVHFYFLLSYPRSSLAFFRCSYYCYHCSLNIGGGDHEKLIILLQLYAILMPPIK